MHPLGLTGGCSAAVLACTPGSGGARLVSGSGLLRFFGRVDVSALSIKSVGPVPQLQKGATLADTSGLSCSFIWGFPPWAWCPALRKPLLSSLLPVVLSPALLALPSAPPSAGMATHEGLASEPQKASEISYKLLCLLVRKEGNGRNFLGI